MCFFFFVSNIYIYIYCSYVIVICKKNAFCRRSTALPPFTSSLRVRTCRASRWRLALSEASFFSWQWHSDESREQVKIEWTVIHGMSLNHDPKSSGYWIPKMVSGQRPILLLGPCRVPFRKFGPAWTMDFIRGLVGTFQKAMLQVQKLLVFQPLKMGPWRQLEGKPHHDIMIASAAFKDFSRASANWFIRFESLW